MSVSHTVVINALFARHEGVFKTNQPGLCPPFNTLEALIYCRHQTLQFGLKYRRQLLASFRSEYTPLGLSDKPPSVKSTVVSFTRICDSDTCIAMELDLDRMGYAL